MPKRILQSGKVAYIYRNGENRGEMWKENPYCHWCGVRTTLPHRPKIIQRWIDDNLATRDHLFHKKLHADLRSADKKRNGGRSSAVLACYDCNIKRGNQHLQEYMQLRQSGRQVPQGISLDVKHVV